MPVTIKVSSHGSSSWTGSRFTQVQSPQRLLQATASDEIGETSSPKPSTIVQTSFQDHANSSCGPTPAHPSLGDASSSTVSGSRRSSAAGGAAPLFASKNGFVNAVMEAYNNHHNLVLRPDDVWLAVLTQLSVYVNAHAEELRSRFVAHDGTERLHIEVDLKDADHGDLAVQMTRLLDGALSAKDPGWRDWVLPRFTTTDKVDETVAAVVMMGTFQKFFTYSWGTRCGIPAVTLLGEARDWVELRRRVVEDPRLASLGKEPAAWATTVLRPVLDGLVDSFANPEGARQQRFWQAVCDEHLPNGSGTTTYSGWITAFCYWDEKGNCLHDQQHRGRELGRGGLMSAIASRGSAAPPSPSSTATTATSPPPPSLAGVRISRSDVPTGFVKCPLILVNAGLEIPAEMVAGSVAMRVRRSVGRSDKDDREERKKEAGGAGRRGSGGAGAAESRFFGLDEVQPESGWFLYLV